MLHLGFFAIRKGGLAQVDLVLQAQRGAVFLYPDHAPDRCEGGHRLIKQRSIEFRGLDLGTRKLDDLLDKALNFLLRPMDRSFVDRAGRPLSFGSRVRVRMG